MSTVFNVSKILSLLWSVLSLFCLFSSACAYGAPRLNFSSVGGYDYVKHDLTTMMQLLQLSRLGDYPFRVPSGYLLYGPPGTGKTMMIKALAGEAISRNATFLITAGSDFHDKYVGVAADRVRGLFEQAAASAPCIVYIDEIDALGSHRSDWTDAASTEKASTLNQLLVEMDGFVERRGVFVVGSTNRLDKLDPALLRPKRFDKIIYMGYPDVQTRKEILSIYRKRYLSDSSPTWCPDLADPNGDAWHYITQQLTQGMTGAEIENLLNQVMIDHWVATSTQTTTKQLSCIGLHDVERAWSRAVFGTDQPAPLVGVTKRAVAVHEVGHAVVAWWYAGRQVLPPVRRVSIESPSSHVLGYTLLEAPSQDTELFSRKQFIARIDLLLGGRVAEEMLLGHSDTTSGAVDDLARARYLAYRYIGDYGLGPSLYAERPWKLVARFLDKRAKSVRRLLEQVKPCLNKCIDFLEKHLVMNGTVLHQMMIDAAT